MKFPEKSVDIASDSVRNPLKNFLAFEKTKDGAAILEKTMARFKFVKVISSVLIANAFIGFVLPKINQSITRAYHKQNPEAAQDKAVKVVTANNKTNLDGDTFNSRPTFDSFAQDKNNDKDNKKNVAFGFNLLSVANKFESDRNYKLLSVDAGTASGRA